MCQMWGVNRCPLRSAIAALTEQGIVYAVQGSGTRIAPSLLFAVIQIQAVPLPQHRKEGAGHQIMLLQAGGQRGGNIGRFDKGGLAVENAQAGDSIGIFSQHQMKPPGKLPVEYCRTVARADKVELVSVLHRGESEASDHA